MSSSLLERTLGQVSASRDSEQFGSRRTSGGGARASPYSRPAEGGWKHDMYSNKQDAADAPKSYARPKQDQGKSAKLQITNLHYEVSERELEALFGQIGAIVAGPKIRFDKSGRSTGMAWVTYGTEDHAAQAKEAFDGALAKGQEIKLEYDYHLDNRATRGQPAAGTLLARLNPEERPAPRRNDSAPRDAPRGPRASAERGVGGAARGGASRGGGRGGARGGREPREPRAPREKKTNEDLDAELENFMKGPSEGGAKPAAPAAAAPAAESAADVEMA